MINNMKEITKKIPKLHTTNREIGLLKKEATRLLKKKLGKKEYKKLFNY